METRANYALIGAFVILAAIAALGFTLWLGQSQLQQEFDHYDIVFDGPVTLEEGSAVRYIGIKVGEVQSVRIDRSDASKVRARIRIDAETPVKKDSVAVIDFAGITGVTFVQIRAGTPTSELLSRRAGDPVPVIKSEPTQIAETVRSVSETLAKLDRLLNDDNIASITATIENLETISAKLAAEDGLIDDAGVTLDAVADASASFNAAARTLGDFGEEADQRISDFGDQFGGFVNEMQGLVSSSERVIDESARAAAAAANALDGPARSALEDTRLMSQDLRRLISRLDRIAREMEQNPQSFVVGDPAPYEEER